MNKGYNVPLEIDIDAHFKFHKLFGDFEEKFFLKDRQKGDENRIHSFVFKDFIKDQEGVLFKLYKEWGIDISPEFRKALEDARSEQKDYKKKHNYKNPTLAELGVEESFAKEQFAHYNTVFGIK